MSRGIDYSIIVPVYNGEKTIPVLLDKIMLFFAKYPLSYEVIFVHDCGKDDSWRVIEQLKAMNPEIVKGIKLTRNFGQHNAIICGFKHASGNFVITMDEDCQHDPSDIGLLIDEQARGDYDIVYGTPDNFKHSTFRNLSSDLFKKMIALGIPELNPKYSPYRLMKGAIAKSALEMHNSYTFLDGYLTWVTTNTSSITVSHHERLCGVSSYTFFKLIAHAINVFVTFSILPIRLVTFMSFLFVSSSFVYSLYYLARKVFFNDLIPGFASIMVVVGFGFGTTLFALGIVGEYIYRINLKTTRRPDFVERERI